MKKFVWISPIVLTLAGVVFCLLKPGKTEKDVSFAREVPHHATYSAISCLIEKGLYQEALEQSVVLKEAMQSSQAQDSILYLHSLLRLASLQRELQNGPGEKAAWEELEELLQKKSEIGDLFLKSLTYKAVDLTQYIAERKKVLHF